MNFIDPDSFVDPDQHPKGAWSEVYKKYLANHRAGSEYDTIPPIPYAPIPGAEAYDNTPPMSYDEFSKLKDKEYRDRLIAVPETALHMGLGMGSAVLGGLVAPLAPVMPWAHTRDPQKMFEDISALPSAIPKLSDKTDDYLRSVGSVMQAFPATGNYPGLLRPMKVGQAAAPTVQANLKALAEKKKAAAVEVPPVVDTPIPDTLANRVKQREETPLTPSQLKEWKDTQDKFTAYQKEQEQLSRANQAQEAINARQAALEQDVATQTNQDFNAAERARQEQAPTGYADWVEQQRQSANERQPGNNAPMEFESPYPVDANDYPHVLGDAPYQPDNFIDPDTAGQKALPITVADTLQTGMKSEDPFARTNASRTVARNILETDLHPPIIKTVDARRFGGKQSGAVDFQAIVDLFPKFKGTKVTEPVYHGRTRGFRTGDFNTKRGFKGYYDETGGVDSSGFIYSPKRAYPGDLGAWFSSTGKGTDTFAGARTGVSGGQVHQSYINLQSPKIFKTHGDFIDWFHSQTAKGESASKARRSLIKDGHDGIVIEESRTDGGGLRSDYVVFDSNNIKNAISPQMNSGMARGQRGAMDWGDSKTNDFLKKLNPFSRENRFTKIQQQTKTLAENFQESFPVASKWLQQRSVQELINDMVDADKTDNPIQYWQEKLAGVSAAEDPTIGGQMKPIGRNTSYGQARGPKDMMEIRLSPQEAENAMEMAHTIKILRDEFTKPLLKIKEPSQIDVDSFSWPNGKDPMSHDERMKNAAYKRAYEKQGQEIARWNQQIKEINAKFEEEYGFSPSGFDEMSLEYGKPEDHIWSVIFGLADKIKRDEDNAITAYGLQGFSGMGKNQRGMVDLGIFNKAKQKLIEEATKSKIWAEELTGQQVVDEALAHGKDAKGATNFSAGGSLEAEKRANPLVRGGVRILQRFKNQSENAIRESVFPAETSLRKLSRNELADLGEAFKQEMFLRERFSMEELAQAGLNEKQLLAYKRTRDMFTDALEAQNKVREIQGLKPISENEAYLSSRWQGDFRMPFMDERGRLKWYLAADSKRSLEKQASELLSRFPGELTPGDMSIVRSSKRGTDAQSIYTQMLDVLGRDDPAVAKIAKWVEESTVEQGRKTLGQEKHFEPKANVKGFVGDRPWNNPKQEAIDMFQQQINYAKNAHNWTSMQLAGQELKHIFANEDLANTQPHALKYLKEYYADNLGFNEHPVVKAFEDFVRDSGYSPNMIGRGIGNVKAVWVLQKLAVNAGFAISNVIQASNMLPHLADLTIKHGANPLSGLALGIPTGLAMAAGHATQQPGKFHRALGAIPGYDVFIARAMKYAEDNSVIARSIYDESPIESSFRAAGQASKVLGKTITAPETVLRSVVYMTYVNALKHSKKMKNDVDIFRLAEEKTNISMGDYREGERAMVFNKMGNLGNALNTLQTYPMNFYNQWVWAGKETVRGNPVPAMVMLGAQTYMAGAMGIPGFAEADKLLEYIKDHLAESAPTVWNKVKNFSLKKIMLDVSPDLLYGGASGRTGVALTARAAAPIPSEMVQTPGAPAVDLLKQGASVVQAAVDPTDKQKVAQAILNTAPTGLQGALETGPLQNQTSVQTGDTRTYGKIKDLSAMEGQVARTPQEESLRAWGLRSQREVSERDQTYATQKHIAQAAQITRDLPGKIYNKLATNQTDDAREYIELYVELSGKAPTRQQIETQMIARFTTPGQRLNMKKNMPLEAVLAVKRLHETLDRMGYAN